MRNKHRDHSNPEFAHSKDHGKPRRGGHHHHHQGGRRGGRPFDYGELRTLVLAMMAEGPRHGYELIKSIEDRMGGSYSPSPGVIYPTLSWLEDMGYAMAETEDTGRKRYRITAEGQAFLTANRAAVEALFSRIGPAGTHSSDEVLAPVVRGMENLKLALRLRLKRGALDQTVAEHIAAALDAAAQTVERS